MDSIAVPLDMLKPSSSYVHQREGLYEGDCSGTRRQSVRVKRRVRRRVSRPASRRIAKWKRPAFGALPERGDVEHRVLATRLETNQRRVAATDLGSVGRREDDRPRRRGENEGGRPRARRVGAGNLLAGNRLRRDLQIKGGARTRKGNAVTDKSLSPDELNPAALMEEDDGQFREVLTCGIVATDREVDLCGELVGGCVRQDKWGRPGLVDDGYGSRRARLGAWADAGGDQSRARVDRCARGDKHGEKGHSATEQTARWDHLPLRRRKRPKVPRGGEAGPISESSAISECSCTISPRHYIQAQGACRYPAETYRRISLGFVAAMRPTTSSLTEGSDPRAAGTSLIG